MLISQHSEPHALSSPADGRALERRQRKCFPGNASPLRKLSSWHRPARDADPSFFSRRLSCPSRAARLHRRGSRLPLAPPPSDRKPRPWRAARTDPVAVPDARARCACRAEARSRGRRDRRALLQAAAITAETRSRSHAAWLSGATLGSGPGSALAELDTIAARRSNSSPNWSRRRPPGRKPAPRPAPPLMPRSPNRQPRHGSGRTCRGAGGRARRLNCAARCACGKRSRPERSLTALRQTSRVRSGLAGRCGLPRDQMTLTTGLPRFDLRALRRVNLRGCVPAHTA